MLRKQLCVRPLLIITTMRIVRLNRQVIIHDRSSCWWLRIQHHKSRRWSSRLTNWKRVEKENHSVMVEQLWTLVLVDVITVNDYANQGHIVSIASLCAG